MSTKIAHLIWQVHKKETPTHKKTNKKKGHQNTNNGYLGAKG